MHRLDGLGGGGRGGGWGSQVVSDATMNWWFVCVCVWRGGEVSQIVSDATLSRWVWWGWGGHKLCLMPL